MNYVIEKLKQELNATEANAEHIRKMLDDAVRKMHEIRRAIEVLQENQPKYSEKREDLEVKATPQVTPTAAELRKLAYTAIARAQRFVHKSEIEELILKQENYNLDNLSQQLRILSVSGETVSVKYNGSNILVFHGLPTWLVSDDTKSSLMIHEGFVPDFKKFDSIRKDTAEFNLFRKDTALYFG